MIQILLDGPITGLLDHLRNNLAEMFLEVPEPVAWMFLGMIGLGIPISLWLVYHGGKAIRKRQLVGGAMLAGIGLMMTGMAIAVFLISVEVKFGYPLL